MRDFSAVQCAIICFAPLGERALMEMLTPGRVCRHLLCKRNWGEAGEGWGRGVGCGSDTRMNAHWTLRLGRVGVLAHSLPEYLLNLCYGEWK